jgi:probable O-glycosylation ligase (exosortase A-associated)
MKGLLFTYALTYGGAAISLFRPFYGLLIYVCFGIIRPEALWHWSVPQGGNYSRIIAAGLLIGWAINGFGQWRFGKGKPFVVLFGLYLGWALASTLLMAQYPDRGFSWLESMLKVFLPFVAGVTLIENVQQIKQLAWVIALSVSYKALDLNQSFYAGFNRLQEYGFGGMDNNCIAIELVAAVGFMFFFFFTAPKWWQKAIAAGSSGLLVNAIMFSNSRGGMLSLIVTGIVAFILIPKRPYHFAVLTVGILVALRLAGPATLERFYTTFADKEERDASADSRIELWKDCVELASGSPILGVGPRHFPVYAQFQFGWGAPKEAHSLWFQGLAELGFPGIGFLILFYVVCMWRLWPVTRESYPVIDPAMRDMARACIAALCGFMVSSQFVTLEGLELPYYVVLIGAGILKVAAQPYAVSLPHPVATAQPADPTTPALAA